VRAERVSFGRPTKANTALFSPKQNGAARQRKTRERNLPFGCSS
jgi:hypothetical protein